MSTYPKAIQSPGPFEKRYTQQNAQIGVVLHSAEGSIQGTIGELNKLSRRASWHFSISKKGEVYQHYSTTISCWHAGCFSANTKLIGVEHEGKVGEPLTEEQAIASIELVRWMQEQLGWGALERGVNLFEHNEVWDWDEDNAGSTACPSGRIPWNRYLEDAMTEEERTLLNWLKDYIVYFVDPHVKQDGTLQKLQQLLDEHVHGLPDYTHEKRS